MPEIRGIEGVNPWGLLTGAMVLGLLVLGKMLLLRQAWKRSKSGGSSVVPPLGIFGRTKLERAVPVQITQEVQQRATHKDLVCIEGFEKVLVMRNRSTIAYVPIPAVRIEDLDEAVFRILEQVENDIDRDLDPYFLGASGSDLERRWKERNG